MKRRQLLTAMLAAGAFASAAGAQQVTSSPILTIDPERFYLRSAYGQRVLSAIEERQNALAKENQQLQAELEAEEKALTVQRDTMEPEAFRTLADAFDARVQSIRSERLAESQAISDMLDQNRTRFEQAAGPVLEQIMREVGAGVVFDVNFVFASSNAIDITDRAIAEVDAILADTAPLVGAEDQR